MSEAKHFSVLLSECIENLNIKPDGIYVDGTLGLGGHSYPIASRLTTGRLIGIDRDPTAIERAGKRLEAKRVHKMMIPSAPNEEEWVEIRCSVMVGAVRCSSYGAM